MDLFPYVSGYALTSSHRERHDPLLKHLLEYRRLKRDVAMNYSIETGGEFQIHKIHKSQMNSD